MAPKLLQGKVVVFTGTLSMPRNEATAMAVRSGASVTSTVTAATNVIVVGAGAGSKLEKASAKGIDVWTEAEFIRRMTVEDHQERLGDNKARQAATTKTSLQFSLAWDAFVDLDLHLTTPTGEVNYINRNVDGCELDVDRNPNCEGNAEKSRDWKVRPVENIICTSRAKPGTYSCFVEYFGTHIYSHAYGQPAKPVSFTVHYRLGDGIEDVVRGVLSKFKQRSVVVTFTVAADGSVTTVQKKAAQTPKDKGTSPVFAGAPAVAPKLKKTTAKSLPTLMTSAAPAAKKAKAAPAKKAAPKKAKAAPKKAKAAPKKAKAAPKKAKAAPKKAKAAPKKAKAAPAKKVSKRK